jgi:hypothetical protein
VQGTGDNFYKQGQLLPENFLKAAREAGHDEVQVRVRSQEDYDHSYYFVRCLCPNRIHRPDLTPDLLVRVGPHPLYVLSGCVKPPTYPHPVHANFLKA